MFDIIIKGGTVVDGTRAKPFAADVCIKDGKIADIVPNAGEDAKKIIDASGKIVSPGFIDIHTHSDTSPFSDILLDCKLQQGVTTELAGNCGSSPLPLNKDGLARFYKNLSITEKEDGLAGARDSITDYAEKINARGYTSNIGMLIGHNQLRINVTGYDNRKPTEAEMQIMEELLDREMKRGCFGISLGLIYPPSAFSERQEILRLAKVVAENGGIMAVHMRNEGPKIFEAVEEVISIAEESGVHLEISHFKLMGTPQWHKSNELIKMIEDAMARGVEITCDQYPFLASSTSLRAILPHWAHDGGMAKIKECIKNPTDELRAHIVKTVAERGGADAVFIPSAPGCPQFVNKYLSDIMKENNLSVDDAYLLVQNKTNAEAKGIYFCINKDDMLNIMSKMYVSVGSDGTASSYDKSKPAIHPRNFGTFPQYFQTIRETNLMPIEDAVYKCTALPASVLKITDRGILKPGLAADITVFDFEKIKNNSSYTDSRVKPDGIEYVLVNGELALEQKNVVCRSAGKVILKK